MTETELQAEIKRLQQQVQQQGFQMQQIQGAYFQLGGMCAALVRELLLAIVEPGEPDAVEQAKKRAREYLKHWDQVVEQQEKQRAQPPAATQVVELKPSA